MSGKRNTVANANTQRRAMTTPTRFPSTRICAGFNAPRPATIESVTYGSTVICRSLMYASATGSSTDVRSPANRPTAVPAARPIMILRDSDCRGFEDVRDSPAVSTITRWWLREAIPPNQSCDVIVAASRHREIHELDADRAGRLAGGKHVGQGELIDGVRQAVGADEDDSPRLRAEGARGRSPVR